MEILATLHPDNNPNDNLFPNVKKENIPSKAINLEKLSDEVKNKLPKVISSDTLLPATKLKYLEIDGVTYYIPQRVDVTSNIKITGNKSDILSSPKNLLCILSASSSLAIKVVDKIEGGSEEISTLSEVLPQDLYDSCCARYNNNIYIFGGSSSSSSVGKLNTIYKFNCINKTIEILSVTLPNVLYGACCSIHNDDIYIFGGYGNYRLNTIYKFNCTNETLEILSTTLPEPFNWACCSTYGDSIYIFGGYNGSDCKQTIYKFNCISKAVTTSSVKLPQKLRYLFCSIQDENIYIFGGHTGSKAVNTIYKFNCTTETILTLTTKLPQILYSACCSTYNNSIYIFGGYNGTNISNAIYNFSVSFELTANNVLIYNSTSDYSFELVTNQVTIPIKNVYIGDNTNTAQLANAYLYDEMQTAWVNVNTGEVLTF